MVENVGEPRGEVDELRPAKFLARVEQKLSAMRVRFLNVPVDTWSVEISHQDQPVNDGLRQHFKMIKDTAATEQ